jgi:hypothetical protein
MLLSRRSLGPQILSQCIDPCPDGCAHLVIEVCEVPFVRRLDETVEGDEDA